MITSCCYRIIIAVVTACSELHKVLFLVLPVTFLCMKYLGNRQTDLPQIHMQDVFGPSLGQVSLSRPKIKGQGHQRQQEGQHPLTGQRAANFKVTRDKNGIFWPFRQPACSLCLAKHL